MKSKSAEKSTEKPIEKIGRVSSASVEKGTGKSWDEWIPILTKAGAAGWPHKEIVLYLRKKYKPGPWWEQVVAGCFEIAVGNRIDGRNQKGLYAVGVSRVVPLSRAKTWAFIVSDEGLSIWLKAFSPLMMKTGEKFENEGVDGGGAYGEIRTMTKGEKIRIRWQENDFEKPCVLQIYLHKRPGEKCGIGFQMDEIPNERVKELFRTHWKTVIDELQTAIGAAAHVRKKPSAPKLKSVRK